LHHNALYRCVDTNPPTALDFTADVALGKQLRPPLTVERQRLFEGPSAYNALGRAIWRARKLSPPAPYIAVLQIPAEGPIVAEKTLKDPAHYTVWGAPDQIANCVVSVLEVASLAEAEGR